MGKCIYYWAGRTWRCQFRGGNHSSFRPEDLHCCILSHKVQNGQAHDSSKFLLSSTGEGLWPRLGEDRGHRQQVGRVHSGHPPCWACSTAHCRHGCQLQSRGGGDQGQQGWHLLLPLHAQEECQAHHHHLLRRSQHPQQPLQGKCCVATVLFCKVVDAKEHWARPWKCHSLCWNALHC